MRDLDALTRDAEADPARPERHLSGEGGDGLANLVGRGVAWATASNLVMRFASIAVTALLARLLSKEDFGVFAVALAVYLVVASLAELGMGSAVARSRMEPEEIAPTVASISILVSLVLGATMTATAGPVAAALNQPDAAEPLRVLSLCLVLTGVFAVPGAQLVREFRQDRIFLATVVGFLVANPLLVLLALNGGGATAFAWSRVVGTIATGAVMVASTSRRYLPGWRRTAVVPLLRFGLPLSLANLVNWTLLNADYLLIGRALDAAEVGVYMIAFNVASWSTAVLGSVLNNVVVPAFGRVQGDRRRLGEALVSATQLVGLIALPVAALTVALSGPLVETVFGHKWQDAAPVLSVLAFYGLLYAFSLLYANVLVATAATFRLLLIQLAWISVLVPTMLVGLRLDGLRGAAWAHVVTIALVPLPFYMWAVLRATDQEFPRPFRSLTRPALAAGLAGGAAWLTARPFAEPALQFVLGGLVGATAYAVIVGPLILEYLPERLRPRVLSRRTVRHGESRT